MNYEPSGVRGQVVDGEQPPSRRPRSEHLQRVSSTTTMWHHGRLLRRVLLLSSALTLGGLHVTGDRLPAGWRAARLVPLLLVVVAVVANIVAILLSDSAAYMLFSVLFAFIMWHMLLVFVHLQRHRQQVHELLRRVEAMEEATALCRKSGDHMGVKLKGAAIPVLTTVTAMVWSSSFFVNGSWWHPNYLFPMWVPAELQTPVWFWVLIAAQMVVVLESFTLQVVFDLLLVGLMDAIALFQERLTRYTRRYLADGRLSFVNTTAEKFRSIATRKGERFDSSETGRSEELDLTFGYKVNIISSGDTDRLHGEPDLTVFEGRWPHNHLPVSATMKMTTTKDDKKTANDTADVKAWSRLAEPTLGKSDGTSMPSSEESASSDVIPRLADPGDSLETGLLNLAETHRAVQALATDAAALCSIPTLSQHASVTFQLLVGLYVTINMFFSNYDRSQIVTFVVFLLTTVLRLAVVSSTGSFLITSGQRLSAALVAARWPRSSTASVRFTIQMLVEQTRTPLTFDGYGIFVTQKSTMLAMLSFVLTYFVIMVQMKV